jgi:hypothetical protein
MECVDWDGGWGCSGLEVGDLEARRRDRVCGINDDGSATDGLWIGNGDRILISWPGGLMVFVEP